MGYIYTFDIGSILFFTLTIYFYMRQRRVHDVPDRIYFCMLICGMIALVFDCAAAVMEYRAMAFPAWLLYFVNMLFICAMQTCLPLFFVYVLILTGYYYRSTRLMRFVALLPYIATMTLLLLSPFGTSGIFYIDSAHLYNTGATHIALYVNSLVYVVVGVILLALNIRSIQRAKRNVLLLFVLLLFVAIALQLLFPRYLLTASATALSLTAMFYVLQSPVDRINPYTGAVNRMLLPSLLTDFHGRRRPYTLVQFSLHAFDETVRLYGNQLSDSLLRALTGLLQAAFPRDTVIYMDTWEFSVLCQRALSVEDVENMAREIPDTIRVGGVDIPVRMHVSALPYDGAYSITETLNTADFLLRQMRIAPSDEILYADTALRENCVALLRLESSLDAILHDGVPSLRREPILRPNGAAAAEDVLLTFAHENMRDIPYEQFLLAIGQGGLVWQYYHKLFRLLAPERGRYSAEFPACVPLSPVACMQDGAAGALFDIVSANGFSPECIVFFMPEADVAGALSALQDNIRHLAAFGFGFRLDAFAAGFTDLSQLTGLPVSAVKLDCSLVHDARQGGRQQALLAGALEILNGLNKPTVCAGVDRISDFENAAAAGATLLQGAFLS